MRASPPVLFCLSSLRVLEIRLNLLISAMEPDKKGDVYAPNGAGHVLPHKVIDGDDEHAAGDDLSQEASLFTDKQYSRVRLKFSLVIIPLMCFIYGLAFA